MDSQTIIAIGVIFATVVVVAVWRYRGGVKAKLDLPAGKLDLETGQRQQPDAAPANPRRAVILDNICQYWSSFRSRGKGISTRDLTSVGSKIDIDTRESSQDDIGRGVSVPIDSKVEIHGDVVGGDQQKSQKIVNNLQLSVAHPRLLSKGYSSSFVVNLYAEDMRERLETFLKNVYKDRDTEEHISDTELFPGKKVKVELFSYDIEFSEGETRELREALNTFSFIGKPREESKPGQHDVKLTVKDAETGTIYVSLPFPVEVVDYAFDHVSRPLFSKAGAIILGASSLVAYLLTLMEQIDTSLGLSSGTAFFVFCVVVFGRFQLWFRRPTEALNIPRENRLPAG